MGQQQLLLLILGVIIVGVAIAVGIGQFGANNIQANKNGITASLISIGANAVEYRSRPIKQGGGGNSYTGYSIPTNMARDDYGQYSISGTPSRTQLKIDGKSSFDGSWVATCTLDSVGRTTVVYGGW